MNTNDNTVALGTLIALLEKNQPTEIWTVDHDTPTRFGRPRGIVDIIDATQPLFEDEDPITIGEIYELTDAEKIVALANAVPDLLYCLKDLKRRMDAEQPPLLPFVDVPGACGIEHCLHAACYDLRAKAKEQNFKTFLKNNPLKGE
jgi:hypothetical protein